MSKDSTRVCSVVPGSRPYRGNRNRSPGLRRSWRVPSGAGGFAGGFSRLPRCGSPRLLRLALLGGRPALPPCGLLAHRLPLLFSCGSTPHAEGRARTSGIPRAFHANRMMSPSKSAREPVRVPALWGAQMRAGSSSPRITRRN